MFIHFVFESRYCFFNVSNVTQTGVKQKNRVCSGLKIFGAVFLLLIVSGCTTSPPSRIDNICEIFEEKRGWYKSANKAARKWNASIPVMMAIVHQESRFNAKAKPPRTRILGFIPGPRPSNAYGYAQALEGTWATYERAIDKSGQDRDDFADAIDFVGWYNHRSMRVNSIERTDAYHLYLAYHEGHGGFKRRTFRNKGWLKSVAKKVSARNHKYSRQLTSCEEKLKKGRGFFGLF